MDPNSSTPCLLTQKLQSLISENQTLSKFQSSLTQQLQSIINPSLPLSDLQNPHNLWKILQLFFKDYQSEKAVN
jgi:hypothetical protein